MSNPSASTLIGRKARFSHPHVLQTVNFSAKIVKAEGEDKVWIEMPSKVRGLKFPPLGGKRYGLFKVSDLHLVS